MLATTAEDKILAHMEVGPTGCWLWTGSVHKSTGYGQVSHRGKGWKAHRLSYATFVGPIPEGMEVGHCCHDEDPNCPGGVCFHRRCVNPAHLRPMTRSENIKSGKHQCRRRTHCPKGHLYDEANTRITASGARWCRACDRERGQRRRAETTAQLLRCPGGHLLNGTGVRRNSSGEWRCVHCEAT